MKEKITYKELVNFLSQIESPLGDLCKDLLDDDNFLKYRSDEKIISYLESLWSEHGNYLHEPIFRLKMIYDCINFFSPGYHSKHNYMKIR